MLCKVCNTRSNASGSNCPNCGSHSVTKTRGEKPALTTTLPQLEIDDDTLHEPMDAAVGAEPNAPDELDVTLDDVQEVELNEPSEVGSAAAAGEPVDLEEKDDPPGATAARPPQRFGPFGPPDPVGLRVMLAEDPEILEPGLAVFASEKGTLLGAGYTSAVGEIDLLARDADGGLVVVMVAESHEGPELIGGVLQRIGWVRKHLAGRGQDVRGIVLMERAPESIVYAAAAVADTVAFKTYQVALTFADFPV
jgi:hypothetical protein